MGHLACRRGGIGEALGRPLNGDVRPWPGVGRGSDILGTGLGEGSLGTSQWAGRGRGDGEARWRR